MAASVAALCCEWRRSTVMELFPLTYHNISQQLKRIICSPATLGLCLCVCSVCAEESSCMTRHVLGPTHNNSPVACRAAVPDSAAASVVPAGLQGCQPAQSHPASINQTNNKQHINKAHHKQS